MQLLTGTSVERGPHRHSHWAWVRRRFSRDFAFGRFRRQRSRRIVRKPRIIPNTSEHCPRRLWRSGTDSRNYSSSLVDYKITILRCVIVYRHNNIRVCLYKSTTPLSLGVKLLRASTCYYTVCLPSIDKPRQNTEGRAIDNAYHPALFRYQDLILQLTGPILLWSRFSVFFFHIPRLQNTLKYISNRIFRFRDRTGCVFVSIDNVPKHGVF